MGHKATNKDTSSSPRGKTQMGRGKWVRKRSGRPERGRAEGGQAAAGMSGDALGPRARVLTLPREQVPGETDAAGVGYCTWRAAALRALPFQELQLQVGQKLKGLYTRD